MGRGNGTIHVLGSAYIIHSRGSISTCSLSPQNGEDSCSWLVTSSSQARPALAWTPCPFPTFLPPPSHCSFLTFLHSPRSPSGTTLWIAQANASLRPLGSQLWQVLGRVPKMDSGLQESSLTAETRMEQKVCEGLCEACRGSRTGQRLKRLRKWNRGPTGAGERNQWPRLGQRPERSTPGLRKRGPSNTLMPLGVRHKESLVGAIAPLHFSPLNLLSPLSEAHHTLVAFPTLSWCPHTGLCWSSEGPQRPLGTSLKYGTVALMPDIYSQARKQSSLLCALTAQVEISYTLQSQQLIQSTSKCSEGRDRAVPVSLPLQPARDVVWTRPSEQVC